MKLNAINLAIIIEHELARKRARMIEIHDFAEILATINGRPFSRIATE